MSTIPVVTDTNANAWLEQRAALKGTISQRERYAAGVLPEEELLTLARAELFKAFDPAPRWATNRARAEMLRNLRHVNKTAHPDGNDAMEYETTELTEASSAEWSNLKAIVLGASVTNQHPWLARGGDVTVEPLTHWVTCKVCEAEICRSLAKVSISWAGRTLVREYAL